jgi:hypothetical protein
MKLFLSLSLILIALPLQLHRAEGFLMGLPPEFLLGQGRLFASSDGSSHVGSFYEAVPSSVRLHLLKIDILDREHRIFELRDAVRSVAEIAPEDESVLRRLAQVSDLFGDHAGEVYQRWTEALERVGAPEQVLRQALERGVIVALRDGDAERALAMSGKLEKMGVSRFSGLGNVRERVSTSSTLSIPGGMRGLARAAEINDSAPSARFLPEYARAILRMNPDGLEGKALEERLRLYFEIVHALNTYGKPVAGGREITLDLNSDKGLDRVQKVLEFFGWQIRTSRAGEVVIEVRAGAENSARQEFVSALGIDEAEMKLSLEQRKPFVFRVVEERVPVIFDESYWLNTFLKRERNGRGLIEEMLHNRPLAVLYVGLSHMTPETQRAAIQAIEPEELLKSAALLSLYGSGVAVESGHLVLPGGVEASEAWAKLAGANPESIGPFLRSLINRDEGKLLAYYHALAVLPAANQRFFTRTVPRLSAFYRVFPFADELSLKKGAFVRREDQFVRLARELPLNADGNVEFPGSARVWSVSRGGSENVVDVEDLIRQAGRASSLGEDEILLEMLNRTYDGGHSRTFRQIENFLAVVRVNRHRHQPMDEVMAAALSQNYARYQSVFPYLAALPELTGQQALTFFQAAARLEKFEKAELNTVLGEFHALLKLVVLLNEARAFPDREAAELFASICGDFGRVKSYRDIPKVTFDLVEQILREAGIAADGSADHLLLTLFAGTSAEKAFVWEGTAKSVNLADASAKRMLDVLRLQSITSLDALLDIYRAALTLTQESSALSVSRIEANFGKLIEIVPAPEERIHDKLERLDIARPAEVNNILEKLRREINKNAPSPDNVSKLANELIRELNPFLKTSLTGWIYAYYFSPRDLAVANNRYLVRAHVFHEAAVNNYWPETRSGQSTIGSYLIGGFAQMAAGVAAIAMAKVESSESIVATPLATAQLSAVRSVPWHQVTERSIHFVALRIKHGREFVVRAAFDEELRRDLANATAGTIGPARRFDLLDSIAALDLPHALGLLTWSDLFFLADAFIKSTEDNGLPGPVVSAYNAERRLVSLEQANYFGGYHAKTDGCARPHLTNLSPYEDYADLLLSEPLAERLSDVLLAVAESADRTGLPVEALGLLAENAVRQFSQKTKTLRREDWISAVDAVRSIDMGELVPSLETRR